MLLLADITAVALGTAAGCSMCDMVMQQQQVQQQLQQLDQQHQQQQQRQQPAGVPDVIQEELTQACQIVDAFQQSECVIGAELGN
jgi:hypothetical protein